MTGMKMLLCAWLCAIAFAVAANPAHAGAFTYVSNAGNNANNCSTPALACQDFARAISQTTPFGEVNCVNPGFFGFNFVISQSVTIDCAGAMGLSSTGVITINGNGIVVRLRNMTISPVGINPLGIDAKNMAALYIENCVIISANDQPPSLGIKFEPLANARLVVSNTVISENGNASSATGGGISIAPTGGATASVTLDGVKLTGNLLGIGMNSAGGTIVGAMHHSIISSSNDSGLVAFGGGSPIFWTVDDSKIMNNPGFGIQTIGPGVHLQISTSTITGNGTGVSGPGITSFKNNVISGNATDGTPVAPAALQ